MLESLKPQIVRYNPTNNCSPKNSPAKQKPDKAKKRGPAKTANGAIESNVNTSTQVID